MAEQDTAASGRCAPAVPPRLSGALGASGERDPLAEGFGGVAGEVT
ncbi:MAG TPA: hypothetical protein VH912_16325 [Streptosporangiaceae bacterium]